MDISGIFPPIPTPFNKGEEIDYAKLKDNVEKWNEIPFHGYVVQGSNGEFAYMDPGERIELVKKVREFAPKEKLIIAGAACEGTNQTINMAKEMASVGADSVLVATPCFYKSGMTSEALEMHYTKISKIGKSILKLVELCSKRFRSRCLIYPLVYYANCQLRRIEMKKIVIRQRMELVADACPVPVILYSVPANTGIDLPEEAIVNLSKHPNIIGLKDSGGNITKIGSVIHRTLKGRFQVLAGSASFLYASLSLGAVGGVCALANVLGREVCKLADLYKMGEYEKAKELQHRLILPNTAVTARHGIAGLKKAMEMFGYYGGPTRSPLLPLKQDQIEDVKGIFEPFL